MIKLVAFDWNGTILEDAEAVHKSFNKALSFFGVKKLSSNKFREVYNIPISEMWKNAGGKSEDLPFQGPIFQKEYLKQTKNVKIRSGALRVLGFLKKCNIPAVIYTNHDNKDIKEKIRKLKINYFEDILGRTDGDISHMSERTKEKRLSSFLTNNKIKAREVISVGDTVEEIEISKSLGMLSVALTGGCHSEKLLKKYKPDFLIHNLAELSGIIKKLNRQ